MVAVIHTSSRLRSVLLYNENKLEQGQAECISAFHYPKDAESLNFDQKLNRIQRQLALKIGPTKIFRSYKSNCCFGREGLRKRLVLGKTVRAYFKWPSILAKGCFYRNGTEVVISILHRRLNQRSEHIRSVQWMPKKRRT